MTTRPTDLDTQQHTVEILTAAAEDMQNKRDHHATHGNHEYLPGLDLTLRYLGHRIEDTEKEATT